MSLRSDANYIINEAIKHVLPDEAVSQALRHKLENDGFNFGKLIVVSVGKAGWQMAQAAYDILHDQIEPGQQAQM